MRRAPALLALVGVVVAGALAAGAGGGSGRARVDAVFDNAAFVIPGQQVKIAGAEVGAVRAVRLTRGNKALVEMEIDRQFAPFRADADCTIQPQSLIGEKFVQCTPGTPRARPLPEREGVQTVPVRNTHAPVDLDLVLSTFDLSTRQRAAVIVDALGAGLAGRARELDAVLRRANPALQATDRALAVLDANRRDLRAVIAEAERIVGALARDRRNVGRFLDRGAEVTTTIAAKRDQLERTVDGLPGLLDSARPAFLTFERLARVGAPAALELRAAARPTGRLLRELPPFSADARPALSSLASAARRSTPDVRAARPLVAQLRTFAADARPAAGRAAELFSSMRERGAVEGLQSFVYWAAAALSRFDRTSHILPAFLLPESQCNTYTRQPVEGCSARWGATSATRRARSRERARRSARTRREQAPREPAPRSAAPAPAQGAELAAPSRPEPSRPAGAAEPPPPAETLLDFLLG